MTTSTISNGSSTLQRPQQAPSLRATWLFFAAIFVAVYLASLFTPPLLDDVDAAHAEAAQYMVKSGDWITPKIDGIRYIEKPPLPYWAVAILYRATGLEDSFTTHLPNALAILGLSWLSWLWAGRAWGPRAGFYAGLGALTSIGPFLFTRFIIPEAILSFFFLLGLYCLITGLEFDRPRRIYWVWASVALALLTKGLIAIVFFLGAAIPYLLLTDQWRRWRALKPLSGFLLFLAIGAPWHILCGLANPDQGHAVGNHPTLGNVHGFFYFYFVNEHFLRFFGERYPHDYNKLPALWYWLTHIAWLFPWSLFLPAAVAVAWKTRRRWLQHFRRGAGQSVDFHLGNTPRNDVSSYTLRLRFRIRTVWLLSIFSAVTLIFFAISTNQEYYTFPVWTPLLMLIAGVIAEAEERRSANDGRPILSTAWLTGGQAAFAGIGVLSAAILGWGLWDSRHLPAVGDIGTLLAHRDVADYTLAMSHLFDLTGPSFAALRLPAVLAALAVLVGPVVGLALRLKRRHIAATISIALTMTAFLVAAHIAFARFEPMLSSKQLADIIVRDGTPSDTFIVYGDQSYASSVIFYTDHFRKGLALEVEPRCGQHSEGTTLLWGSCYPDAPDIFLSDRQLAAMWGRGNRKWLFAEDTERPPAEQLLAGRLYPVRSIADKTLWTDRPLE